MNHCSDPRVTGLHTRSGDDSRLFWRCELCGHVSTDSTLCFGCPVCNRGVGWWPLVGMLVPLVFLLVLLGGGYLIFRRVAEHQSSHDPAMEELRTAYARGELSDQEYEERRERLQKVE